MTPRCCQDQAQVQALTSLIVQSRVVANASTFDAAKPPSNWAAAWGVDGRRWSKTAWRWLLASVTTTRRTSAERPGQARAAVKRGRRSTGTRGTGVGVQVRRRPPLLAGPPAADDGQRGSLIHQEVVVRPLARKGDDNLARMSAWAYEHTV